MSLGFRRKANAFWDEMMLNKIIIGATAATLLVLTACSSEPTSSTTSPTVSETQSAAIFTQAATEDTKVKAVLMYADWCGGCKVLDPKLKAVQAAHPFKAVEFSKIDYTGKDKAAFWAQAVALGVEEPVRTTLGNNPKTGLMILIDADDNTILNTITKSMSEAEITTALTDAAAS